MKTCPYCKAQLADEASFCLYCMKPLSEKEIVPPTHRRPKGWLIVLGGIVLLAVLILILWPRGAGDPTAPVMPGTTKPSTPNEVQYRYRVAQTGDDFYASYQNPGDHIVITGVDKGAADGIYHIPSTIDGQTVVAIASNAFYGSGAAEVYIPASVKTVHRFAFFGCPLSDVYFVGKSIFCYDDAFPSGFVLHCAPDCDDRNLRYYSQYASEMGAAWSEWHNMPLMTATDEYGVVYNYRLSVASDHPGDPAYQNPGNHITITSIHTRPADQIYHIPKTLDGLTVAFIGPMAFCQKVANSLYIPDSVIAISYGAFYYSAVKDVYFCHDLYIPQGSLVILAEPTLHCPKDAQCGPDGKVFSEDPRYWNANYWEEWNGEA